MKKVMIMSGLMIAAVSALNGQPVREDIRNAHIHFAANKYKDAADYLVRTKQSLQETMSELDIMIKELQQMAAIKPGAPSNAQTETLKNNVRMQLEKLQLKIQ